MKLLVAISDVNKSLALEWFAEEFHKEYEVFFLIFGDNDDSPLIQYLHHTGIQVYLVKSSSTIEASYQVMKIFERVRPDILHTHLVRGSFISLLAALLYRKTIPKRIYTRHHSTFHHRYAKKGVWKDKIIQWMATDIIAVSENVRRILIDLEHVDKRKVHLIHHGFKLDKFKNVPYDIIKTQKIKYNPEGRSPVIGVIARYIEWKGIEYIIEAYEKFLREYPNALLILANAHGPYQQRIDGRLKHLPNRSFKEISFENEVHGLYQLFDIYIHVPVDPEIEAFGQTYVEALAAGVPSIFTLSGVAKEFIKDRMNALVVPHRNSESIYNAMVELTSKPHLVEKVKVNGSDSVKRFHTQISFDQLNILYSTN